MGNSCQGKQKPIITSQYRIESLANPEQTTFYNQAKAFQYRGDYASAINYYNKAIQANPDSDMSYTGLGNCQLKNGRFNDAIAYYERAIQINPNNKFAYNALGVTYQNLKDNGRAISYYNKSISVDSNFPFPYNGLGNLYYFNRNYNEALPYYENAARLSPNNSLIYANLACCQIMMGKFDESFDTFLAARKMAKYDDTDLSPANRIYLATKLNQFESAINKADPKYKSKYLDIMNQNFEKKMTSNSGLRDDALYGDKVISEVLGSRKIIA